MAPGDHSVADSAGFTLIELLVAITIALVVTAAAATVLVAALNKQPRIAERAARIQQGRAMVESITRELRQGESVLTATASNLELLAYVPGSACGAGSEVCRVSYSCDAWSCSRTERAADGSGTDPAREVVSGISGPNVFSYAGTVGDPSYVAVELVFPQADGQEAVTLADGAALRNHTDLTEGG